MKMFKKTPRVVLTPPPAQVWGLNIKAPAVNQ